MLAIGTCVIENVAGLAPKLDKSLQIRLSNLSYSHSIGIVHAAAAQSWGC